MFGLYNSSVITYADNQKLPANTLVATAVTDKNGNVIYEPETDANGNVIMQKVPKLDENGQPVVNVVKVVDEAGNPVMVERQKLDEAGNPVFEEKPVLDAKGKPVMEKDKKTKKDYEEEEIWLREQHNKGWKLMKMRKRLPTRKNFVLTTLLLLL